MEESLIWFQPMNTFLVTGHAQHHDSEHTVTDNEKHVCAVIQTVFWCDFSILLHHSAKPKSQIYQISKFFDKH